MIDSGIRLTYVDPAGPLNNINCVSLADLLQGNIEQMLQLNYLIDLDFFYRHLNDNSRKNAKITLVHGHRDDHRWSNVDLRDGRLQVITPKLPIQYGTHHTKAMFIIYTDGTALFHVHTANLIPKDWALKTQAVWSSPVLVKKKKETTTTDKLHKSTCTFEQDLLDYLASYGEDLANWRKIIAQYDFCSVKAKLIASVPGYHQGRQLDRWGHMQLRAALADCVTPRESSESYLVAQFSSIGSLGAQPSWLIDEFGRSLSAQRANSSSRSKEASEALPLKLIYPTCQQVETSFEGIEAGYSLPFDGKNYAAQKHYMDPLLCRWTAANTGRDMAMPHIKTYTRVSTDEQQSDGATSLDWFLLTSANLSKAAWGQLQKKYSQLMIRSYELGILIAPSFYEENNTSVILYPFDKHQQASKENTHRVNRMVTIPLPYDLPVVPYDKDLGDVCWTWDRIR
ncbi:tyrosyl-DNA phosphodiesterase I [Syncephalis plumigaleata]|nr:tyrosyl-DNA phosphodiesterase I [Syncephalis plumigaleata]